jgi:hypothetical protein
LFYLVFVQKREIGTEYLYVFLFSVKIIQRNMMIYNLTEKSPPQKNPIYFDGGLKPDKNVSLEAHKM